MVGAHSDIMPFLYKNALKRAQKYLFIYHLHELVTFFYLFL